VRRGDLAVAVSRLLTLVSSSDPRCAPVSRSVPRSANESSSRAVHGGRQPRSHQGYMRCSRVMRFLVGRPVSAAEAVDTVDRVGALLGANGQRSACDSAGRRDVGNLTLANQLTILRIMLIPAFVLLLVYGYLGASLLVFAFAGITDALDGLIARRRDSAHSLRPLARPDGRQAAARHHLHRPDDARRSAHQPLAVVADRQRDQSRHRHHRAWWRS
jgi:hypothetical protein